MHKEHGSNGRLHRRQRVAPTEIVGAPVAATTTTPALAATTTTTVAAAPTTTTTTVAPTTTTTTPAAAVTTTTTTSAATITTTTTTPAAVVTTSSTTSSTTTTSVAPVTTSRTTTTTEAMETIRSTSSSSSSSSAAATSVPQITRTSVVVVNGSTSTSLSTPSGTSLANSDSSSSSGVSTGAVVGIVAGALLGVVVIAAIIGYLLKKKRSHDDDEPSPFDRDEFRRTSAMLDDDVDVYAQGGSYGGSHHGHGHGDSYGGGHSPQMSEISMRDLGRSNTYGSSALPGLARGGTLQNPRPPTAIMQHYNHQQSMPSFQPGQVVPSGPAPYSNFAAPPPSAGPAMDLYGGYPISQQQQAQLDRAGGLYAPQHAPQRAPVSDWNQQQQYQGQQGGWMPQQRSASPLQSQQGHVERAGSNASAFSGRSDQIGAPALAAQRGSPNLSRDGSSDGHGRPLSLVPEDHEQDLHRQADSSSRSGTPTNDNPQMHFFSHGREDSLDGPRRTSVSTQLPSYQVMEDREREREAQGPWGGAERQRRLSIRNGGLDEDDDAYGGM